MRKRIRISLLLSFCIFCLVVLTAEAQVTVPDNGNPVEMGVLNGRRKVAVMPRYPAAAAKARIGGVVKVSILVDADGDVTRAEAVSGDPLLQGAAVGAALETKFLPNIVNTRAVPMSGFLVFTFTPAGTSEKLADDIKTSGIDGGTKWPTAEELSKVNTDGKPGAFNLQMAAGDLAFQKGNYAEAIKNYSELIAAYPKFADTYVKRGDAYTSSKNSKLALADYQKALELDPGNKAVERKAGEARFMIAYDKPSDPAVSKAINDVVKGEKPPASTAKPKDELLPKDIENLLNDERLFDNLIDKYPEASKLFNKPYSQITSPEDRRTLFIQYSINFNAQNKIFAEKVTALKKIQNSSYPLAQCDQLLDVEKVLPSMENALKNMERFYHDPEAVKVITAGEKNQLKYIVEDWGINTFLKMKYDVPTNISVLNCNVDPNKKKITLDDIMEAAGKDIEAERQSAIIDQLKRLGDMAAYFATGKRFNALTQTSEPAEVCRVTMDFKKESDTIEPFLDRIVEINEDGLPVKFENPEAAKRLETTLKFNTQLFVPKKAEIKIIVAKYGCK